MLDYTISKDDTSLDMELGLLGTISSAELIFPRVLFYQTDERWSQLGFAGFISYEGGCDPVSIAMVALRCVCVYPYYVIPFTRDYGFEGVGVSFGLFTATRVMNHYQRQQEQVTEVQ